MTMRVIDVAPNEASLTLLAKRLEEACSGREPLTNEKIRTFLEMDPRLREAAKSILREYLTRS